MSEGWTNEARMPDDEELRTLLDSAKVLWRQLTESELVESERQWRGVFGESFQGRPRIRRGMRAELEYAQQPDLRWLVVPLSSGVAGTPVVATWPHANGYECEGALVPLGSICGVEFAIFPADLSWTMLHTHEDHGLGGPYFMRREWIT